MTTATLLAVLLVSAAEPNPTPVPPAPPPAAGSGPSAELHAIEPDEGLVRALREHVEFLADPRLGGRAAGTPGGDEAARYVAGKFREIGLVPPRRQGKGIGGYLVPVRALVASVDRGAASVVIPASGGTRRARAFLAEGPPRTVSLRAPVVFAGYGITAPEYQWDDYAGLDVKGKIVLVLDHEPGEKEDAPRFRGKAPTRHMLVSTKAELARRNGAVALLVTDDPLGGHEPKVLESAARRQDPRSATRLFALASAVPAIPALYVSADDAGPLLEGSGPGLRDSQERLDGGKGPCARPLPHEVSIEVPAGEPRETVLRNVIGILPGDAGPRAGESLLIGAHYDHLGTGPEGAVYRGADDNASGVAALIETARRIAQGGEKGKRGRSVVFASFAAEEMGTLGSLGYVASPVVPLERTLAAIDLDMLGRDNADKEENARLAIVFWSAQAPWLPGVVRPRAAPHGLDLRLDGRMAFGQQSDHASFHDARVPVLFYFSGWHADYHEPGDTPEKLRLGKTALLVDHLVDVVSFLRAMPRPAVPFDPSIREVPKPDPYERPY